MTVGLWWKAACLVRAAVGIKQPFVHEAGQGCRVAAFGGKQSVRFPVIRSGKLTFVQVRPAALARL